jgi:hypothetical protein
MFSALPVMVDAAEKTTSGISTAGPDGPVGEPHWHRGGSSRWVRTPAVGPTSLAECYNGACPMGRRTVTASLSRTGVPSRGGSGRRAVRVGLSWDGS